MCDDMGFSDIGSYGGEIATPTLDRLSGQGVRFRNFYNNAKCEHTRASLLTGHWWHHVGAGANVRYAAETFGDVMRRGGYRTLMAGKWHAGDIPTRRGFDRYYGLTDGCCNFWNPGFARPEEPEPARKRIRRWAIGDWEMLPMTPRSSDFYTTEAFTDAAIDFVRESGSDDRPVLLYLAYTAPHYPLHAPEDAVAKYRGKYSAVGWDELRRRRFERQKERGVLPPHAELSPRDPDLPAWETISRADRDQWDLRMATYAAMIEIMDRQIARVLQSVRESRPGQTTWTLFFSDNGACEDSADRSTVQGAMPWEVTSYLTQGRVWANASNTPYRQYKTTNYEGGVRTPLIAHRSDRPLGDRWSDQVGHVIDVLPTLRDLAGLSSDAAKPGRSLLPAIEGGLAEPRKLYWEFGKARAIRDHDWKAVRYGKRPWELYDLASDPTEIHDLASDHADRLETMVSDWSLWREDSGPFRSVENKPPSGP